MTTTILTSKELNELLYLSPSSMKLTQLQMARAVEKAVIERLSIPGERNAWADECRSAFMGYKIATAENNAVDVQKTHDRFNENLNRLTALPPVPAPKQIENDLSLIYDALDVARPNWFNADDADEGDLNKRQQAVQAINELAYMVAHPPQHVPVEIATFKVQNVDAMARIYKKLDEVIPKWTDDQGQDVESAVVAIGDLARKAELALGAKAKNQDKKQIENAFPFIATAHPMTAIYDLLDDVATGWDDDDEKTVKTACAAIRSLAIRANAKQHAPLSPALSIDLMNAWKDIARLLDGAMPGWSNDKLRSPGILAVRAIKELAREANLKQAPAALAHGSFDRIFAALDKAIPDWERRVIVELVGKS